MTLQDAENQCSEVESRLPIPGSLHSAFLGALAKENDMQSIWLGVYYDSTNEKWKRIYNHNVVTFHGQKSIGGIKKVCLFS